MEGFVPFVFGKGNFSLFLNFADVCKKFVKICRCLQNPPNTKASVSEEMDVQYFCRRQKRFTFVKFRKFDMQNLEFYKKKLNILKRVFRCILRFNSTVNTAS
jgi:hypothetical protein